ncbi:MAG: carboxypeptidase M32 [Tepidisphaeraceae bacterium]
MSNAQTAYDSLRKELYELYLLRSAAGLLGWDEQTHLPKAGTKHRAEQSALLSRILHERFTSPQVGGLIESISTSELAADPESDVGANTRELKRAYLRSTKIPASLVEEMSKHDVLAQAAWVEARKNKDFAAFAPVLAKTFDLKRQEANCVGFTQHIYDALIDDYEPHETTAGAKAVLEGLREPLAALVRKVQASGRKPKKLAGPFPIDAQEKFGLLAAQKIGFDLDAGRLDVSVHPFCTGLAPGDTRITTRYRDDDLTDALFGVLHEMGHALYEQGLLKELHGGMPLGESVSLGIHESQSRMWENNVGRSRAFWAYFGPIARQHLPSLNALSDDELLFAMNEIAPGFIRVEADETTYNLHILLRFELETQLIAGELDVKDLPDAWNARMTKYLGLTPPDDAVGCLQDIHWSAGLVGYFPTYTLGNLYAAQFYEQARIDLGDLDAMFAKGEFAPLLNWLREKIHRHGRRYTARQLCRRITGKDLSSDALLRHLNAKVDEFYS